ncbi:XRN_N domain-containing protein [Trichonephila inaurata madagascariensis]|uniref:XRN_N domain-containing protein n=1 Tax=Trichonephila inaurata madagascariensis TaxID=2747483 RepID=A0A8X6YB67_9ARAC|nr:XRN_N domain-containing protein [Trichonephila inaurata madagascariensis]
MGIPNFTKLIDPFYTPSKIPSKYDSILVDAQSFLYIAIDRAIHPVESTDFLQEICKLVWEELYKTLISILDNNKPDFITIILSFDGEGIPMKWPTQKKRRNEINCKGKNLYRFALFGNNTISQSVQTFLLANLKTFYACADAQIIISGSNVPGEGEHKIFYISEKIKNQCQNPIIVSVDHDVFLISLLRIYQYDSIQVYRYKKFYNLNHFVQNILPYPFHRLIVCSFLFGNDFIPSIVGITANNASTIHTIITNLTDSSSPELIATFLMEMEEHLRFDKVPYIEESHIIDFWKTFLWISDYYLHEKFPQRKMINTIFDAFDRNMLITALSNIEYSNNAFIKAQEMYKQLETFNLSAINNVFDKESCQKLNSFWIKNDEAKNGICNVINISKNK